MSKGASASIWSLHNPLKGWTLHGVSVREARLIAQTLGLAEQRTVSAWQPGWAAWKPLDHADCAELRQPESSIAPQGLPALPAAPDDEITVVAMERPRPQREWKREFERITAEIPAEVLLGNQRFRTTTENLSEGGIKFKQRLPDWVAGYFTVILNRPEGSLEVTCMLVEDQKDDKTRVAVVETDDEESHLPMYRDWIKGTSG